MNDTDKNCDTDRNAAARHELSRLANDPALSIEQLSELARSDDELIRGAVALNQRTPVNMLRAMLSDASGHVQECLATRRIFRERSFVKPSRIAGHRLRIREVSVGDAPFIYGLRTDARLSKHLSGVEADIGKQEEWISACIEDPGQIYFLIQDKHNPVGAVRLYDRQGDSFCWGSWVLTAGLPYFYWIESALIVYHYALSLGFKSAHFGVRKENVSVCRFHENFGAKIVSESERDFLFTISEKAIDAACARYSKFLPAGIKIEPRFG